jgi:hypothetical protein
MIVDNSPLLGTFSLRDDSGVDLDVERTVLLGYEYVLQASVMGAESESVQLTPNDTYDLVEFLALQMTDHQKRDLVARLQGELS